MFIRIILLLLAGLLGGIFGGMGMGGGTLLIPLLTLFCDIPQHTAQAVNLVSFVPMAVAALVIHIKKKNVDFKDTLFIIIPACIASVGTALLAQSLKGELLSMLFGIFLGLLGIAQLTAEIFSICKIKKEKLESARALEQESEVDKF